MFSTSASDGVISNAVQLFWQKLHRPVPDNFHKMEHSWVVPSRQEPIFSSCTIRFVDRNEKTIELQITHKEGDLTYLVLEYEGDQSERESLCDEFRAAFERAAKVEVSTKQQ